MSARLDCQKYQLVVSWNYLDKTFVNGLLSGYKVILTSHSYKSSVTKNFTVSGNDNQTKISPLDECIKHTVSVAAITRPGLGPFSDDITTRSSCPCGTF